MSSASGAPARLIDCPGCGAQNPQSARFCMNCGERLVKACPQCAADLPPGANFCPECGATVAHDRRGQPGAGTPASLDVDKYIPAELAARLAGRPEGELLGERRTVTMLFCDLKGSTAAAEQLDPEVWTDILNGAFERMIQPVYQFEGTVARLMGDAILAFFGAPVAHEDDPRRAVLAALEIQRRMFTYQAETRASLGISLEVRVGINTGLVVVGEVGSDQRLEYTAIGDAINLAARMEQTAAPGTIQIAEATYRLVHPYFEFQPLGEVAVKGKEKPVRAYRVLGARSAPDQLRGLGPRRGALVGRAGESARLMQAVQGLIAAGDPPAGGVIWIEGEAGLGKTTLLADVRQKSELPGVRWLSGAALAYMQSAAYYPWRELLGQSLQAGAGALPAELRQRLAELWQDLDLPAEELVFLEAVLGLEGSASADRAERIEDFDGEELVQRLAGAVRTYIQALARETALALVFDDLQWADEASLALLAAVTDLAGEYPVLFFCLARPDPQAAHAAYRSQIRQQLGGRFQQLALAPLDRDETSLLTAQLLASSDLAQALSPAIQAKADGNPLYVEELIRSLQENNQLIPEGEGWRLAGPAPDIRLPENLNSLLSARIDRLPESTRRLLQVASVFGSAFDARHLQLLAPASTRLDVHLERLQQAGMIAPAQAQQPFQYIFHHSLLQEAAYRSLLHKDRRRLHARLGELLEGYYADRVAEFATVLAHHFYAAQDRRSVRYDALAGEEAARLYANREAAEHFARALETARQQEMGLAEVAPLALRLGHVFELDGQHNRALENYQQLEDLAHTGEDPAVSIQALMAQATVYATFTAVHDPARGAQKLEQALTLARQAGDQGLQARLHWNLMIGYLFSGQLEQAVEHIQPAVALARQGRDTEQLAMSLNDAGRVYSSAGEYQQAWEALKEARQLWQELGNQVMLADNLGAEASVFYFAGQYDRALEAARQAYELSLAADNLWGQSYSYLTLGYIYLDRGQPDLAVQAMQRCIEWGDQGGLIISSVAVRSDLAWAYGVLGDIQAGLDVAQQALAVAEAEQPDWKPLPAAALVRLHVRAGRLSAAQAAAADIPEEPLPLSFIHYDLQQGLAKAELALAAGQAEAALAGLEGLLEKISAEQQAERSEVLLVKARTLTALDRQAAAWECLLAARQTAEALGARQSLWPVLAQLAGLEALRGRSSSAAGLRAAAREIVDSIAARLEELGLRSAYLVQPEVQSLLGSSADVNTAAAK